MHEHFLIASYGALLLQFNEHLTAIGAKCLGDKGIGQPIPLGCSLRGTLNRRQSKSVLTKAAYKPEREQFFEA